MLQVLFILLNNNLSIFYHIKTDIIESQSMGLVQVFERVGQPMLKNNPSWDIY